MDSVLVPRQKPGPGFRLRPVYEGWSYSSRAKVGFELALLAVLARSRRKFRFFYFRQLETAVENASFYRVCFEMMLSPATWR